MSWKSVRLVVIVMHLLILFRLLSVPGRILLSKNALFAWIPLCVLPTALAGISSIAKTVSIQLVS